MVSKWSTLACSALLVLGACTTPAPEDGGDGGTDSAGDGDGDGDGDGENFACESRPPIEPEGLLFADISDASGIRDENFDPEPPAGTQINDHSRLAFADIDGDGFDDVVAHSLFPNAQNGVPFEHLVFRNNGDGTFANVSDESGLRDVQAAFFAFADVDNDGDQDVFAGLDIPNYGESAIYLNDGAGVFSLVEDSGVARPSASTSAANATFADFDGDGLLDLFVGNGGTTFAAPDDLFLGHGDGTFERVTQRLAGNTSQPSNGSIACDIEGDGDLDILISTYSVSTLAGHNLLYINDGAGNFEELGAGAGFAYQSTGNYHLAQTGYGQDDEPTPGPLGPVGSNGFGLDCGDVDNDGDLDVLLSAISHPVNADYSRKWSDPSQLLANVGDGFENQWLARGLPFNEGDVDAAFVDFDNDGNLDLSLSRDRKYEGSYDDADQKSWFGLMWQVPSGQYKGAYESMGVASGINDEDESDDPNLRRMKGAQNHAWSDIDHDGDLDLLVGGRDQGGGRPNFLFRNDVGQDNRYLAIELVGDGVTINRDAIGARVTLEAGDELRMREKKSSRGMYNSEDTRVLHFGLGDLPCDATLTVRWPDGEQVTFLSKQDFGEDQRLRITYPDTLEVLD